MFYLLCKHQWITTSFHFNSFCTERRDLLWSHSNGDLFPCEDIMFSRKGFSCWKIFYPFAALTGEICFNTWREISYPVRPCGTYISHALVKGQNYWALIGWERGKYFCNQERVWKLCDFLNLDNNRYGPKENFAKICQIKWNWIRSVKFEIVRKDFSMTLSVCCHLKLLLPWQRDVTTSLLHWSVSGYTYH